jgi:hypothetical protein
LLGDGLSSGWKHSQIMRGEAVGSSVTNCPVASAKENQRLALTDLGLLDGPQI